LGSWTSPSAISSRRPSNSFFAITHTHKRWAAPIWGRMRPHTTRAILINWGCQLGGAITPAYDEISDPRTRSPVKGNGPSVGLGRTTRFEDCST
jgi:hypothetical protein